ncbi:MAG: LysE family transporter [Dysgonamonadaceae bacterium]
MFIFIIKGIIIGLLISSPMGPIGMLTIQRTLLRGRWHGFATGVGAMLSDLVYAILTMLAVGKVSYFIEENKHPFLWISSIILIGFGLLLFRTNPIKDWASNVLPMQTRYLKDFATSFVLTFSNVSIIFVILTLYTQMSFNPVKDGTTQIIIAISAIAFGALLWWFVVTSIVSKMRKHFNRSGLILLNRAVGSIFMIIGAVGLMYNLY